MDISTAEPGFRDGSRRFRGSAVPSDERPRSRCASSPASLPTIATKRPAHPERGFTGSEQVRKNWQQIFAMIPDLSAEVLRFAVEGDTVWSEWEHRGTRPDGSQHVMRGVVIFGVDAGVAAWARFYLEPVELGGGDVDAFRERQLGVS